MDPTVLTAMPLIYVMLQGAVLMSLDGFWRVAAIFPVPLLCIMLIGSVAGGLFGVPGAEIMAAIAVPVGLIYLILLIMAAWLHSLIRHAFG